MNLKIRGKLILSYICIILVMAIISLGFVSVFSESYILSDAQNRLETDAIEMAQNLETSVANIDILDRSDSIYLLNSFYSKLQKFNYSLLILGSDGKLIISKNMDNFTSEEITELSQTFYSKINQTGSQVINYKENSFASYIQPIKSLKSGSTVGYIVPFFPVSNYSFDKSLSLLYFFALSLAGLFAVLLGTFMSDTLTRNIKRLKTRANLLANREFDISVPVDSTDEIGELAQSIDTMAKSIKEYDLGQKVFLQNASHEFRTPLMSIRGYVEGANDGVFETEKANEEILNQVTRLEKLVEEVLYLSKIENTEGIYNMEDINLSDIIDESAHRTRGFVSHEKIKLTVNEVPQIKINGDGDKLATVLTNIITNCLRFARSEIIIDIKISDKKFVVITISDDGPGLSAEDIPHLFDRFYKGKKGNHGLGLAIAKAIVMFHNGSISAHNKEAITDPVSGRERCGGAVFEIRLPIKEQK